MDLKQYDYKEFSRFEILQHIHLLQDELNQSIELVSKEMAYLGMNAFFKNDKWEFIATIVNSYKHLLVESQSCITAEGALEDCLRKWDKSCRKNECHLVYPICENCGKTLFNPTEMIDCYHEFDCFE